MDKTEKNMFAHMCSYRNGKISALLTFIACGSALLLWQGNRVGRFDPPHIFQVVTNTSWIVLLHNGTSKTPASATVALRNATTDQPIPQKTSKDSRYIPEFNLFGKNQALRYGDDGQKKLEFLSDYKNPCYFENTTIPRPRTPGALRATQGARQVLQCVPYFVIPGFPKCASTDLFKRLSKHPQIQWHHKKEPNLLHRKRFNYPSFADAIHQYYFPYFRTSVEALRRNTVLRNGAEYHEGVIGEASVDYSFDNARYKTFPGNENLTEPRITNADYMYAMNPNMKIIFLLREPVERTYSDYIFEARFIHYMTNPTNFHMAVLKFMNEFKTCTQFNTIRGCAYNRSFETFEVRLRVGMYHIFIEDWMNVFGRENVIVIRSEDTQGAQKLHTFRKVIEFLDLKPISSKLEAVLYKEASANPRSPTERLLGDMLPKTRKLLEDFYRPFNVELNKLLPAINYNSFYKNTSAL